MLVSSTMVDLGFKAPDFCLPEPRTGKSVSRDDAAGPKGLLVAFLSNHCPFVQHLADHFARLSGEWMEAGLGVAGINANDPGRYPEDAPERMPEESRLRGYRFPYLFDRSQETPKAYRAACTPDFFLFGAELELVYRGRYDASRPSGGEPTGEELALAARAVIGGRPVSELQLPSMGCDIKWRKGNEPAWRK